ncbi:serine hydrolase domain-containing protein [Sphingobium aromaticiconvertens]|uniref:serine hydrolase domain-containing protein n=1 Tax=Sphingobium aromaticiconvertens TaxID=365341 RepID=UPI003017F360
MDTEITDPIRAAELGMDAAKLDALVGYLDATYVHTGKLPHMQLLVSRDEQPLLMVTRGQARADGAPLQSDALFRIASMTKPVTSVAFMILVEAGQVALSDPVETVIPEFRALRVGQDARTPKRPMLMRDLLRHTSGLTYGLQRQTPIDAAYRALGLDEFQQSRNSDEFIAALADLPLEFSPGEKWNYSVSTDVLGVVVERLSGQRLDAFFADRIFVPLGMADTFFQVPKDKVHRLTDAWQLGTDGGLSLADRGARSRWSQPVRFCSGGGGLVSGAADYHRFAAMLLRGGELDGTRLLCPETIANMRANHLPDGRDLTTLSTSMFSEAGYAGVGFGLGFGVTLDASVAAGNVGEYYWGGIFSTYFCIDPVERLIAIFMTQHLPSTVYPVRAELRSRLQDAVIARRAAEPLPKPA